MDKAEIEKMLEKQLQLLSERSSGLAPDGELPQLTQAMINLVLLLRSFD